jgi:hypothetical protein
MGTVIVVNDNISYSDEIHVHKKASEEYIAVKMKYPGGREFDGWVPIEYRRTGVSVHTAPEISDYLKKIYKYLDPCNDEQWLKEAEEFWKREKPKAVMTKAVFDALKSGKWVCAKCKTHNRNWSRRFQELKEDGFTFATKTNQTCPECHETNATFVMCLHLPRYTNSEGNGYEQIPTALRKRILKVLDHLDAYEGKKGSNLLPDHKFSEIRWDKNTKEKNLSTMSEDEIRAKFQLLSNQRNEQKREVCRNCFQTGIRPSIYGITYFYKGNEHWDPSIPTTGKDAEQGCVGCPWYDIEAWREALKAQLDTITKEDEKNGKQPYKKGR